MPDMPAGSAALLLESAAMLESVHAVISRMIHRSDSDFMLTTAGLLQTPPGTQRLNPVPGRTDETFVPFPITCVTGTSRFAADAALLSPPFGPISGFENPPANPYGAKRLESLFLYDTISRLPIGGRCAAIVPDGLLSRAMDKALRRELVEHQRLEAVILLPLHTYQPYANVYTAVLSFVKTGEGTSGPVWMYDARSLPLDGRFTQTVLRAFAARLLEDTADPNALWLSPETLAKKQFCLDPARYIRQGKPAGAISETELYAQIRALQQISPQAAQQDNVQLSFFGDPPAPDKHLKERRAQLRKLCRDCQALMEQIFCEMFEGKTEWPTAEGHMLFSLRSGRRLPKDSPGRDFPVYGGNGVKGWTGSAFAGPESALFIIGRVGTYCGSVRRISEPCWIDENAFYLDTLKQEIDRTFLLCLMRHMDFNSLKYGSCSPQISQADLLELSYILPPLKLQREFAERVRGLLASQEELEYALRPERK